VNKTGRSIQDDQTNIREEGTSLELPILNVVAAGAHDDDDGFEMSCMLFEADEYFMTVDEKQQIKDRGNFHHEFQFLEIHRICLKHHDDDDIDDGDVSPEDVTDIRKC
jgi:hypothetical protein